MGNVGMLLHFLAEKRAIRYHLTLIPPVEDRRFVAAEHGRVAIA